MEGACESEEGSQWLGWSATAAEDSEAGFLVWGRNGSHSLLSGVHSSSKGPAESMSAEEACQAPM